MKVSINMLVDRLCAYSMDKEINSGSVSIDRIRIMSPGSEVPLSPDILYLIPHMGMADGKDRGVQLLCGNDSVFLHSQQPDRACNDVFEAKEYYDELDRAAEAYIDAEGDLQGLLCLVTKSMRHNAFLIDKMLWAIAIAENVDRNTINEEYENYLLEHRQLPIQTVNAMLQYWNQPCTAHGAIRFRNPALPVGGVYRNMFLGEDNIGYLLFPDGIGPLSPGETQMANIVGHYVERWFEKVGSQSIITTANFFNHFLDDELEERSDLSVPLSILHWDNKQEKEFICVKCLYSHYHSLNFTYGYFKDLFSEHHPFIYRESMCLIRNRELESDDTFYSKLKIKLTLLNSYAGVSYSFCDISDLKSAYNQAVVAHEYGNHAQGTVNHCGDFKLDYIRKTLKDNIHFDLLSGELQTLKRHDERYSTEYYKTLYIYLLNERNQLSTARELGIHRNTLLQRIHKLNELLNADLESREYRAQLLLSYFVLEGMGDKL